MITSNFSSSAYMTTLTRNLYSNKLRCCCCSRLHRPPSKELIKLFIRAFAIRGGFQQNSPWSVQEDLVTKYSIPSKFADFLVSTSKVCIATTHLLYT